MSHLPAVAKNIQMRPITEVHPYPQNAKLHPMSQVKKVADSIREFGFNQPIVVDAQGVIIVGHGRYRAATEILGMGAVPVLVLDIPEEKARAYRLADNKLNESEWDMTLVMQELRSLSGEMVDLSGFGDMGINLSPEQLGDKFSLNGGKRSGFQQMTFTLSDRQVETIKTALKEARGEDDYLVRDHDGNENQNGAALAYIVDTWLQQKT